MLPWKAMSRAGTSSGWPMQASSAVQAAAIPAFSAGRRPQRGEPAGRRLDDQAELDQVEGMRQALADRIQPAQHVGIEQVPVGARANPRAAARPHLDQPLLARALIASRSRLRLTPSWRGELSSRSAGPSPAGTPRPRFAARAHGRSARRDCAAACRRGRAARRNGCDSIKSANSPAHSIRSDGMADPRAWPACSSNHPMIAMRVSNSAAPATGGYGRVGERRPR